MYIRCDRWTQRNMILWSLACLLFVLLANTHFWDIMQWSTWLFLRGKVCRRLVITEMILISSFRLRRYTRILSEPYFFFTTTKGNDHGDCDRFCVQHFFHGGIYFLLLRSTRYGIFLTGWWSPVSIRMLTVLVTPKPLSFLTDK